MPTVRRRQLAAQRGVVVSGHRASLKHTSCRSPEEQESSALRYTECSPLGVVTGAVGKTEGVYMLNGRDERDTNGQVAGAEPSAELVVDLEWCQEAGFTRMEAQRLIFVRWLYREGQLTEYPDGKPT